MKSLIYIDEFRLYEFLQTTLNVLNDTYVNKHLALRLHLCQELAIHICMTNVISIYRMIL